MSPPEWFMTIGAMGWLFWADEARRKDNWPMVLVCLMAVAFLVWRIADAP